MSKLKPKLIINQSMKKTSVLSKFYGFKYQKLEKTQNKHFITLKSNIYYWYSYILYFAMT